MIIHLENENYDEIVNNGLVVVDFFATWCGPCKMLSPVLEEVARDMNIKIVKVDIDDHLDIAKRFGIMSVPTLLVYKDGNVVDKLVGFMPKELIENKLSNYK